MRYGADYTVYIVRHSDEDLGICKRLKSLFADDAKVKLIEDDLSAIELEGVLEKFDFIIASRYHSIVHAYKNSVPAIVMGWAGKYFELLREFDQAEYYFDCRNTIDIDDLNAALKRMIRRRGDEKRKIASRMNCFCANTVFDLLVDDLAGCGKGTSCQPATIEERGVKL
ncbi:MAG: polysaccharide pyruvyl transferase family protein [Planctomycetota bacterium]